MKKHANVVSIPISKTGQKKHNRTEKYRIGKNRNRQAWLTLAPASRVGLGRVESDWIQVRLVYVRLGFRLLFYLEFSPRFRPQFCLKFSPQFRPRFCLEFRWLSSAIIGYLIEDSQKTLNIFSLLSCPVLFSLKLECCQY